MAARDANQSALLVPRCLEVLVYFIKIDIRRLP